MGARLSALADHRGTRAGGASAGADALVVEHLSKRFGKAYALSDVSLTVRAGEVHGLLGSNGSGKSTLIKVLAGFHAPEPGARVALFGEALPLPVKADSLRRLGLAFVHQHLGLIPSLSVTENLRLGRLATVNQWRIDWRREHAAAGTVLQGYDLAFDPRAPVASLSAVEQALLAIVRADEDLRAAAGGRPGVLVLDEPTPFLPRVGVERLFRLVRQVVAGGSAVIFVSHDVDEVMEITDRCTILRDGHLVGTLDTPAATHDDLVERIVGRSLAARPPAVRRESGAVRTPAAAVEALSAPGLGPLSLDVGAGEVLGLTGLIGSGYDRVLSLVYGAQPATGGRLVLAGADPVPLADMTPRRALAAGIVFLPADRLGAAGVAGLDLVDNATLPVLERLRNRFGLDPAARRARTLDLGIRSALKPNVPELPLGALSGGNQQKILMAKWLQLEPRLVLLDEPTQGVDVGARRHLWGMLEETALAGAGLMIASTDYDQLAAICHRVLIFARGQVVAEVAGDRLTKESIAEHCYRSQTVV